MSEPLTVRRQKNQIWSPIRQKWLYETPEEAVRQEYLCVLVNEYGFALAQMDEEVSLPGERGNKNARADFVLWLGHGKPAVYATQRGSDIQAKHPADPRG